jgi:glycosyltransferase involved in cell wall biosynthesis
MAAYNTEKYIGDAIKSILHQTYNDYEFLILDDGSTDKTWEIIQNYAEKNSRIKIFRNSSNTGIAASRNFLITQAQGMYIAWADADDISYPKRLSLQYEFMQLHPTIGICSGFLDFFDEQGIFSTRTYAPDDATLRKTFFRDCPIAEPAAMIRRDVLQKVGFHDTSLKVADDLDMHFRMGLISKLANIQEPLIKYRRHRNSLSVSKFRIMEQETLAVRKRYTHRYPMSFYDSIYNVIQTVSQYVIPTRLKIWLFMLLRNSKT